MTDSELIQSIFDEIKHMRVDIKDHQITIENVTNKNIKIIAEGHLDLSRKLDEALKSEGEKELLLIKVNHLENEIRQLKDRISLLYDNQPRPIAGL